MAQVLTREFECLTCHALIKISKIDNQAPGQKKKWDRFELDGKTPHVCKFEPEPEPQSQPEQPEPKQAELKELSEQVRLLTAQVQMLRVDMAKALKELAGAKK